MRQVVIKLLPDRSGRVLIHWFVHDEQGPIETPVGGAMTALGPMHLGGAKGRIACMPGRGHAGSEIINGQHHLFPHSDDVRAATCPDCLTTDEAKRMLLEYKERLDPNNPDLESKRAALAP